MSNAIHLGIDTNSFGFAVTSTAPVLLPRQGAGWEGFTMGERRHGWVVGKGDTIDRLELARSSMGAMLRLLPTGQPVHLWVEEALILMKNIETTRKLVIMTGVLYGTFLHEGPDAFWHWVDVSRWRKEVLGKGSGKKDELKRMAREHVAASWAGLPDEWLEELAAHHTAVPDLYDAACIAEYGARMLEPGMLAWASGVTGGSPSTSDL